MIFFFVIIIDIRLISKGPLANAYARFLFYIFGRRLNSWYYEWSFEKICSVVYLQNHHSSSFFLLITLFASISLPPYIIICQLFASLYSPNIFTLFLFFFFALFITAQLHFPQDRSRERGHYYKSFVIGKGFIQCCFPT